MKIKIGRKIIACVVMLMVMTPGVLALKPANSLEPSYITVPDDDITVDGFYNDWDLEQDHVSDMYNAGNPSNIAYSNLYMRYNCGTETLYVLVKCIDGFTFSDNPDDMWIKDDTLDNGNKKIMGMDGGPGNMVWVKDDTGQIIGYEASVSLAQGEYTKFEAHAQMSDGATSSTGKKNQGFISLKISCDTIPIPEFPTIALPIAAILGLMFILFRRNEN